MDDWTYPYQDVDLPDTQPALLFEDGRVMEVRLPARSWRSRTRRRTPAGPSRERRRRPRRGRRPAAVRDTARCRADLLSDWPRHGSGLRRLRPGPGRLLLRADRPPAGGLDARGHPRVRGRQPATLAARGPARRDRSRGDGAGRRPRPRPIGHRLAARQPQLRRREGVRLDVVAQQGRHREGRSPRERGPARGDDRHRGPRRGPERPGADPVRGHPGPRPAHVGDDRRDPAPRRRHGRGRPPRPVRTRPDRTARCGRPGVPDQRRRVPGPHRPRRRRRAAAVDRDASASRRPRTGPPDERRARHRPDPRRGAHRGVRHVRGSRNPDHQAGARVRRRPGGTHPRPVRAGRRDLRHAARRHGHDRRRLAHLAPAGARGPHRVRARRPGRDHRRPRRPPDRPNGVHRSAVGDGRPLRRRHHDAALLPRRLELDQLHHQAPRPGCLPRRPGAGADPQRTGRAAQLHGRVPDPAVQPRRPADGLRRMGRRHGRGAPRSAPDPATLPRPRQRHPGPPPRREARLRPRPHPPVRGRVRHRRQDHARRRVRTPPRRVHPARRLRTPRLDLAQDAGFAAATLPLGLGLTRKADE